MTNGNPLRIFLSYGHDSFTFQLATLVPDWLSHVVTSRPESAVQTPLHGLNTFVLGTHTETNRADLCDCLRQKLAPRLHDRLIGQILYKSKGQFLNGDRFCDVQRNHLSPDRPDQFPQGLGGIFYQWFQRQFPVVEEFRKDLRAELRSNRTEAFADIKSVWQNRCRNLKTKQRTNRETRHGTRCFHQLFVAR